MTRGLKKQYNNKSKCKTQSESQCEIQGNTKWLQNDLAESTDLLKCVSILKDFRCIPIYPTVEDITKPLTSLRANHTNHPYKSCDDYLDTFFRLMREDFISVVRKTFKLVTKVEHEIMAKTHWYFKNVKVVQRHSSVTMFFQFDTARRAAKFNYENSQQFKNGSLLFLSKDKFTTFTLGIVTNTKKLNKGVVGVDVINFSEIKNWKSISLLEPKVFYEPYRYVMAVLQDMDELNFPMKKYIVYSEKNISFPAYLKNKNSTFTINAIQFDILQDTQWPSPKVLNMDVNQYNAFKGALLNEFAMIQGPPGTGKTYIGLEIVKTIIENMYKTQKLTHPILVVCMTNHALDQFLEGIYWETTRNISRFGRGTNSEILVDFFPTMKVALNDKCADIYVKARHNVAISNLENHKCMSYIKYIERNQGILDLSCFDEILCARDFGGWFQDSYDLIAWLMFDIPHVNGVNPLDFIKKKKLLTFQPTNVTDNQAENDIYCISLKSIKLYCTQVLQKLDSLDRNLYKDNVSCKEKQNLELKYEIMSTVQDYLIKHLKCYMSESKIECNNQINRDSLNELERWLLYFKWVHIFLEKQNNVLESSTGNTRQSTRDMNKFKSIGFFNSVKNKFVIGMTTTAAARNRYLLKNLKCPIGKCSLSKELILIFISF